MKKSIYELDLHEITEVGEYHAMRVVGGWVYLFGHHNPVSNDPPRGVYVPDTETVTKKKEE